MKTANANALGILSGALAGALAVGLVGCLSFPGGREKPGTIPVRGLHLLAPAKKDLPALLTFIRETLPREGVNTLILELNYGFDFRSRAGFGDPQALNRDDAKQILKACRAGGIELIPQINCLGHQSWRKDLGRLLARHPEFSESSGAGDTNKEFYCRSYCPLHPDVHKVLFALIDEMAAAFEARSFHVGMDEVFILADPACPRCKGRDPAELFAGEVNTLHDHLKSIGCRMWMWSDRFLDGRAMKVGKWEGSENGTQGAIAKVPRDIVMCDWHYDAAPETPQHFAKQGFDVVACPWRKAPVALAQLAHIRSIRAGGNPAEARRARGVVQTTWCSPASFIEACNAQQAGSAADKTAPSEAAACFRKLAAAWRETPAPAAPSAR